MSDVVRSDFRGQGLGRLRLEKLIRHSRDRGTRRIAGQVLSPNRAMRDLAGTLGFEEIERGGGIVEVRLTLGRLPRS